MWVNKGDKMGRTAELVLGIIGGIFGILAAMFIIGFGGFSEVIGYEEYEFFYGRGGIGLLLGCIGIIGAAIVNRNNKIAGGLMLLSAVGGLLALGLFWSISFILLLVGGLLAFRSK